MNADECRGCPLVPAESVLDRRSFIANGAASAVAIALAACAFDSMGPEAPASIDSSLVVAAYPQLANTGGVALVNLNGAALAIVRTGASSFVALSRVCPHQGGTININGTGFRCTRHGATFDATGNWIGGQRTSGMRSYPTSYDPATDTLTIG